MLRRWKLTVAEIYTVEVVAPTEAEACAPCTIWHTHDYAEQRILAVEPLPDADEQKGGPY